MTEDNIRYEVNHSGEVVQHNSALCKDMDTMISNLFSQYGWHCKIVESRGSYLKLLLRNPSGNEKYLNVFKGTIRNEKRNPYEKKIQLGTILNPLDYDKHNTLIIGVYVYEEYDELKDTIFVSFPIDNRINYSTNPSLRGVQTNKLIQDAKNKGFVHDKESNNIGFRPEFIFYYLDNFYNMHYSTLSSDNVTNIATNQKLTPEWFREQAIKYTALNKESEQIRESFINKFGPNKLKELFGVELLNKIFLNGSKDNLCYVLEYDTKNRTFFGSIKGGSSIKFGLYYSNNNWKTNPDTILTEEQAIKLGGEIRDNILKGTEILELYKNKELTNEIYKEILNNLNNIDGMSKVWVLKYFQMIYPNMLPTFYNEDWINKILNLLDIEPKDNKLIDMGQISMFIKECGISNTVFAQICYDYLQNIDEPEVEDYNEDDKFESEYSWNRVLFGAPGTGKSFKLKEDQKELLKDSSNYERVTFHPDYSYANFVGTYKPVPSTDIDDNECITYKYVPGPFMRTLVKALKNKENGLKRPYLLIIEEINRANMAAVFGDIFQLLDRDEKGNSVYPIQASEDMRRYLASELGGEPNNYNEIKIPNNMFIWATMNSADQGVYPMDTAFKRRWDFEYISIDNNEEKIKFKNVKLGEGDNQKVINWNNLRKAINDRLSALKINEDKLLGPYFISKNILDIDNDKIFRTAFKNKVLMYLFEDAAKQKRSSIFSVETTKYSSICEEFDKKGIDIFCNEITSQITTIEELQTEDNK